MANLQHEFSEGDVRDLFSAHGQVDSVAIIRDHDTRRSKDLAFVEMPISIQAKAAIKALDGLKFQQLLLSMRPVLDKAKMSAMEPTLLVQGLIGQSRSSMVECTAGRGPKCRRFRSDFVVTNQCAVAVTSA